jgi:hypothetical protein
MVRIDVANGERKFEWDVTGLLNNSPGTVGGPMTLVLRGIGEGDSGRISFHSREGQVGTVRPRLEIQLRSGSKKVLLAAADTFLDCTTNRSLGDRPNFSVGRGNVGLLGFNLGDLSPSDVKRAVLRLTTTNRQYGAVEIGIYRLELPIVGLRTRPALGLAARYPQDRALGTDPGVLLFVDHETEAWRKVWQQHKGTFETVQLQARGNDAKSLGRVLQVTIPTGGVTGANLRYFFRKHAGGEPLELYARYYLRFDSSWNSRVEGGKLPGFAGTYNRAGWGGRQSDGTNGWSARGYFQRQPEPENPLHGFVSLGTNLAHADNKDQWGDTLMWSRNALGILERNRWYCIEQYVRMNDVGRANGVLRTWIDGEQAFEKTDITYRTVDTLKIEEFWLNVYHGGTRPTVSDQRLYIDNIVIAREYIGPMVR